MKYSCRIMVKGRLGREWSRFLEGWKLMPQRDGTTLLEGASVDETSVQALLGRSAAPVGICPLRPSEVRRCLPQSGSCLDLVEAGTYTGQLQAWRPGRCRI